MNKRDNRYKLWTTGKEVFSKEITCEEGTIKWRRDLHGYVVDKCPEAAGTAKSFSL